MIKPAAQFTPEAFGFFAGISMADYQAAAGFSKSRADLLHRSPMDYARAVGGDVQGATDAMELGTVYHSRLWEGRCDFYVRPDTYMSGKDGRKPWNANASVCKAWLEEHSDMPVYSRVKAAEITTGVDYIKEHPHASVILAKVGMVEVSMFARHHEYGYRLKGRADKIWFDDGKVYFADLKTIRDASTRSCSREILNRRYHVQAAFYRYIAAQLGFEFGGFVLIFFEEGRSPKCNVRWLAVQAIDQGEKQMQADIELYRTCRLSGVWPEWPDQEEQIGYIDLPDFVYGDVETLTGMTAVEGS